MINEIIENLFTEKEYQELLDFVFTNYAKKKEDGIKKVEMEDVIAGRGITDIRLEDYNGRSRMEFAPLDPELSLPKHLTDKMAVLASKYLPGSYLESCYFVDYCSEFGNPKLGPHIDNHPASVTIDYQLKANTDWAVGVNGTYYTLKDNQALMIDTNSQIHYRQPKIFSPDEHVYMIFFHFSNGTQEVMSMETRRALCETQYNLWIEEAKAINAPY
jgi:hypothetical protein